MIPVEMHLQVMERNGINMSFNVAVDGPAGAGKSTIARAVAEKMNLIYVDTGAMYRAMTLSVLREGVNLQDRESIIDICRRADITIRYEKGEQVVVLDGENVNAFLRTEEVGNVTSSVVSPIPEVRERMVKLQQELAASSDCIMDGRDIGTCVLPNAQLKIYLTASSRVRAERRYQELMSRGVENGLEKIQADIEERDYQDMHREISPLRQAEDAVLVDTSEMSVEEVISAISELCRKAKGNSEK